MEKIMLYSDLQLSYPQPYIGMKKIKFIALLLVATFIVTACGKDPFMADISYQPPETQEKNREMVQDYLEKYNNESDAAEKARYAKEVGFFYMQLGNYREAIKYYEKVLEFDAVHFPALNNIAYMYEEAGDYAKAIEYQKKLYENNATNREVVADTIRILVRSERFDEAVGVLTAFSNYDKSSGNNYVAFLSEQFEFILNARQKAEKS